MICLVEFDNLRRLVTVFNPMRVTSKHKRKVNLIGINGKVLLYNSGAELENGSYQCSIKLRIPAKIQNVIQKFTVFSKS